LCRREALDRLGLVGTAFWVKSCPMRGSSTQSLFPDLDDTPTARDELNFAEFPIALLSDRPAEGVSELVFKDQITDKSSGRLVERRVKVLGIDPYGLPNSKDEEILLGLISLTKLKTDFTSRELRFTRYELAKHLRWPTDGRSYRRIDEALERWTATTLRFENSWWDAEDKEWKDVLFHVIETAIIGRPHVKGKGGIVTVQWSSVAFKSFQAGYIKNINLQFYQSLDSAAAKRLYRFLDKHFYHRPRLEYDLAEVAFEKVGLSRDYEPWKVKQKLQPAIAELEERGFLEPLNTDERYIKAGGRGRWRIVFVRKSAVPVKAVEAGQGSESPLVAELVSRGLHESQAKKLVAEHAADVVTLQLEAFDWLMKGKSKPRKPASYLFSSIDQEYALPDGFTPKAVLQAQAEEKKRQLADEARKRQDEERAKRLEQQQEAERRGKVDAYLKPLSDAKRKEFEERALAVGPAELVEAYRKAAAMKLSAWAERHRYILFAHVIEAAEAQAQPA